MRKIYPASLLALAFIFVSMGLAFGEISCTPNGGPICGDSPPNQCNDYCDGIETPGPLTAPSITYYQTDDWRNPSKSVDYGSGTYLKTAKTFHDETYASYTCGCCAQCVSGSCCSHDWCSTCNCKDTQCEPWQTCSDTTDPRSDKKAGCACDENYCEGWCRDYAPVYDGDDLAGCNLAKLDGEAAKLTTCERYFKDSGGICATNAPSGKKLIRVPSLSLCPSGQKCYIDDARTCSNLDSGGYCAPAGTTTFCDSDAKYWRVKLDVEGILMAEKKFTDCGDLDCCVPVETSVEASDPRLGPKYTLVPYELKAATGSSCYCNYLTIKDYYECADAVIDDSHPCQNNNCAPDFVGGRSFCCPKDSCSHYNDPGVQVLCQSQDGKNWASCDSYLAKDQTANPSVMCIPNKKEILYNGNRLACDSGQWKNSQSCGETLFNYPLNSDATPQVSEVLLTDPTYGFKNSPIAFYLNFDKQPKDVIAYVVPKAASSSIQKSTVKITAVDSKGKILIDSETKKEIKSDGTKRLKLENVAGAYKILFSGGSTNPKDVYNISVDCYTPDKSYCDYVKSDCLPGSYCVEDSPQNTQDKKPKTCQRYTASDGTIISLPKEPTQNCFYCCPKGYCAHKVAKNTQSQIKTKLEDALEMNPGEETYLTITDSQGKDIPSIWSGLEQGKSICEVDTDGKLNSLKSFFSFFGQDLCKAQVTYDQSGERYKIIAPEKETSEDKAKIRPLEFSQWQVGAKKEFLFYDSHGDRISSGIEWCVGDSVPCASSSDMCKLASTSDFGVFEARGEGDCIISAKFNGEPAEVTEKIVTSSAQSNIQVYVEKTINPTDDYTIECYPPGTHKLDTCNWICMDGVWGKGMSGQPCENDCDCNLGSESDEDKLACIPIKEGESKGTCCKAGQCASENSCVEEGSKKMVGGVLSECTNVNGVGKWVQSGIVTKSSYGRAVLSASSPEKEVGLEITKNDLSTDNPVRANVHLFFEKWNYQGDIIITEIDSDGNEGPQLYRGILGGAEVTFSIPESKIPVTFKAKISADPALKDGEYILYSGSTLVVEVLD